MVLNYKEWGRGHIYPKSSYRVYRPKEKASYPGLTSEWKLQMILVLSRRETIKLIPGKDIHYRKYINSHSLFGTLQDVEHCRNMMRGGRNQLNKPFRPH